MRHWAFVKAHRVGYYTLSQIFLLRAKFYIFDNDSPRGICDDSASGN